MKKKLVPLLLIPLFVFSVVMMSPVGAQGTTVGVEPPMIVDEALVAGSFFTVDIWIRNVTDLAGVEFKLGYDNETLSAVDITYGGIFGGVAFELINVIHNDEGWCGYSVMEMFGEPPFTGDGRVANVTFEVMSYGHSDLDLYGTQLAGEGGGAIDHTVIDGYFNNVIPGDICGDPSGGPDGDVDRYDFGVFSDAYGSFAGDPEYNLLADICGDPGPAGPDGDVDRYDFGVFSDNYGR